jgi:hypothetical protein
VRFHFKDELELQLFREVLRCKPFAAPWGSQNTAWVQVHQSIGVPCAPTTCRRHTEREVRKFAKQWSLHSGSQLPQLLKQAPARDQLLGELFLQQQMVRGDGTAASGDATTPLGAPEQEVQSTSLPGVPSAPAAPAALTQTVVGDPNSLSTSPLSATLGFTSDYPGDIPDQPDVHSAAMRTTSTGRSGGSSDSSSSNSATM